MPTDEHRTFPAARVLLDVAIAERAARLDSLDALDQRAGALLGFTGAIVALATFLPRWWLQVPVYVAGALTAHRCLRVLQVEHPPGIDPRALRRKYLRSHPDEAAQVVLDTVVKRHPALAETLAAKAAEAERRSRPYW
jgi:hypothetical protein